MGQIISAAAEFLKPEPESPEVEHYPYNIINTYHASSSSTTTSTTTTTYENDAIWQNITNYYYTPTLQHAYATNSPFPILVENRRIGAYNSAQRILLVGEGDFSFSLALARAFGSASNMISTSLNSLDFLRRNYSRSLNNVAELRSRGCTVLDEINATEMANHSLLGKLKFDRIIFNFPLAGFFGRQVPLDQQIRMNQALVYHFMGNAKKMLDYNGEIHITHKSYGFFQQWNLQQLGYTQGLWLFEELNFDRTEYPGYHTKYGFGGDKDFDCHNSKTYKFRLMLA